MLQKTTFAEALGLNPAGDDQLRFLGEAAYRWAELGQHGRAAAIFEGLTLLAPNHPAGHLGLAEIQLKEKRHKEAHEAAQQALRCPHLDRPTMAYTYVLAGLALSGLKKPAQARKAWETARELDPDGPGAAMAQDCLRTHLPPDSDQKT